MLIVSTMLGPPASSREGQYVSLGVYKASYSLEHAKTDIMELVILFFFSFLFFLLQALESTSQASMISFRI